MKMKRFLLFIIILSLAFFTGLGITNIAQPGLVSYNIRQGEHGVIQNRLSNEVDKDNIVNPGSGLKFPWNDVYVYSIIERSTDEQIQVLDKYGNFLDVLITIRFTPIPEQLGHLHDTFGQDFQDVMVIPELRSTTRQVMQHFSSEEIYNVKRERVEELIKDDLNAVLEKNYVRLSTMLIRSIELPDSVRKVLEEKYRQMHQQK